MGKVLTILMSFSACTSPRHGRVVSILTPVCAALRLGSLVYLSEAPLQDMNVKREACWVKRDTGLRSGSLTYILP